MKVNKKKKIKLTQSQTIHQNHSFRDCIIRHLILSEHMKVKNVNHSQFNTITKNLVSGN